MWWQVFIYKFDALPRGRVWYDLEEKSYMIVFYRASEEYNKAFGSKIKKFGIGETEITVYTGAKC